MPGFPRVVVGVVDVVATTTTLLRNTACATALMPDTPTHHYTNYTPAPREADRQVQAGSRSPADRAEKGPAPPGGWSGPERGARGSRHLGIAPAGGWGLSQPV